jgi:Holliday junction DNA helicase RuvA
MIGKIKGTLVEVENNVGLVETISGIFYEVYLTNPFLGKINLPEDIEVYIYHHIREDIELLFGFETRREYKLYMLLLGVSGVGAKTAFSIISHVKSDSLVNAVTNNDVSFFTNIPGLGKKTALKIILELSTKFKTEFILDQSVESPDDETVIKALTALGFSTQEARKILPEVATETSIESKITAAIRKLSSS